MEKHSFRSKAAAINPSDMENVSGYFPAITLPRTLAIFAGIVVTGKKYEGAEVWGSGPRLAAPRAMAHRLRICRGAGKPFSQTT